ncbi:hypothetical protein [Tropicimonas sp. IMCC6043]|uniref:hypothetical protein n=1 Tax=Tropicimonas sp. IMCC6043 TaxID=2510645 RepID=UPI00101D2340|nr:hypothetical protein [Tropicimonas sp. IMCC6043]RYH11806.1 hypothetical protein EU800_04010 [Tropicimonas sp. IMCC6043]
MSAFLQEPIRKRVFYFAFPEKALASVSLVGSTVTRLLPWRAGEAVTRLATTYRERVRCDVGVDRNRSVGRDSGTIIRTAWDDRSH